MIWSPRKQLIGLRMAPDVVNPRLNRGGADVIFGIKYCIYLGLTLLPLSRLYRYI
jgi:hypothetical protein